ncbi:MAG: antirestriction protein [Alphaproteobacteria bacterium]|nr:MAG: antirestriction protein [Caulobacteraceae bacterium]TPW04131.1 MAG: antirestriction protein [Alphaproteobacteria bacterium]
MDPTTGNAAARRDVAASTSANISTDINARIIAALEQGVLPWKQPWRPGADAASALPLRANGAPYRGVNIVLLWMRAADCGYGARRWYSFRQARALGACVRKGEIGERVVYYGSATRARAHGSVPVSGLSPGARTGDPRGGAQGDTDKGGARFLRAYVVFNADQIDGLESVDEAPPASTDAVTPLAAHEAWFRTLDIARIVHPHRAFYSPARDVIAMPPHAAFDSPDLYAQTLNHECVHATAAAHRAGRDFAPRYGSDAYAVEEICAELGAAYLGAHLGLPPGHIHDHSAYIGHWIAALKNDRRAFLEAAAKAQVAVDWLLAKSGRLGAITPGAACPEMEAL